MGLSSTGELGRLRASRDADGIASRAERIVGVVTRRTMATPYHPLKIKKNKKKSRKETSD
jgi:hypothetical protein